MSKPQKLTVNLSKRTTSVSPPHNSGKALQHLIAAGTKWVSMFELHEAGCTNPADAILEIKKLGALIQKTLKPAVNSKGEVHALVPHYKLCGWHFDADSPNNTTNPYKESA
jgi:hypothetical protein